MKNPMLHHDPYGKLPFWGAKKKTIDTALWEPMETAKWHRDDAMAPWRLKRRCRIFTRSFASRLRRLRREGFWGI